MDAHPEGFGRGGIIMPRMDLQSGAIALILLCLVLAGLMVRNGLRTIRSARKMTFFHLRRRREAAGWWRLGLAVFVLLIAIALPIYGLPIAYEYFPPSPTPSRTPTITSIPSITTTPTITLTPTITDTPVVSATPTVTPSPNIPPAILALFKSSVTPNPETVFSALEFTSAGSAYPAVRPNTVFKNPVGHMYGIFTYDGMLPGVQWTTLWLREGKLVHYETKPWDGATGGSGYTDWNPPPQSWEPGIYVVQIFVGDEFHGYGRFLVEGDAPTPIPTPTSTSSITPVLVTALTTTPLYAGTSAQPFDSRPPGTSTP
jgi:hypothetical protein